jgi:metallo-beta-lactamase family protein
LIKILNRLIKIQKGNSHVGFTGYSAHADQNGLIRFATKMQKPPSVIKLVHGDTPAKQTLKSKLKQLLPNTTIEIPKL